MHSIKKTCILCLLDARGWWIMRSFFIIIQEVILCHVHVAVV
jgi:hypothetical protein